MKRALILLTAIITINLTPVIALAGTETLKDEGGIKVYLEVPLSTENLANVRTTCTPVCVISKDKDGVERGTAVVTHCKEEYLAINEECKDENPSTYSRDIKRYDDPNKSSEGLCTTIVHAMTGEQQKNLVESTTCRKVQVLEAESGIGLFEAYVGLIYKWAASIVAIVSTVVIIISGVQIAVAGGDTAKIDEAKKRIYQSLAGIVVLFLSALILYTINPNFFTAG